MIQQKTLFRVTAENGFGVVTQPHSIRRLSESTRQLGERFLCGEFGREMRAVDFTIAPQELAGLSGNMASAVAVRWIAMHAPLRILPEELLVGAATLLEATRHHVPGLFCVWSNQPQVPCWSTSHTTIDFESALKTGYRGLREQIETRRQQPDLDDRGRDFLHAALQCLDAAAIWHMRHVTLLRERIGQSAGRQQAHYRSVLSALENVPENPAHSFREAVQSLWFMWTFQRLCGNWSGLGRIDKMLGPYLQRDLASGQITLDEAREWIAHFWIKGCEWAGFPACGNGDGEFYQNVILGGVDEAGQSVINDVTYLVLDVVEELHISDYPIAVRVSRQTPEKLLRRIADVQQLGGGIVAIYNEDIILPALTKFGYPLEEARNFSNDGCWEIIIQGKTAFSYQPFDMLKALQEAMGLGPENVAARDFPDFESLYQAFLEELAGPRFLERLHKNADRAFQNGHPAPLLSIFVNGCIEKARGYNDLGAKYSVLATHAGGLPDTANSLLVLKKLVYDEKRLGCREFVQLLRSNWAGQESLRQEIRRKIELYGNDNPEADAMLRRVYEDYIRLAGNIRERAGVLRPVGISTFGREIEYCKHRQATPFGARQGDILATNLAPTPGTDRKGPTAVIRSFCSLDFQKLSNGTPLELKIWPASVAGETGRNALVSLMHAFVELGGMYLHIDVVDTEVLKDAQMHPEKYPNLSVRISGWSARFSTLGRQWQDMLIQRTQQVLR